MSKVFTAYNPGMGETKKRRWFQIHLSTAVVLMITAGVLMWANLREQRGGTKCRPHEWGFYYGWPISLFESLGSDITCESDHTERQVQMVVNILVSFAILAAVGFTCEWWARRRKPKEPAHAD